MTHFHVGISKVSKAHILPLFCNVHRDHVLPYLIREYVKVRFQFESKRLENVLLSKSSANVEKHLPSMLKFISLKIKDY